MAQAGQRKCLSCWGYFFPDPRVGKRQIYCAADACQRESKAHSQARWRSQPQNLDYFCGPVNCARVRAWRAEHPGYSRGGSAGRALQDECVTQAVETEQETTIRTLPPPVPPRAPLQDSINTPSPILAGLIAHLFNLTLQDEMATTTRRLVQLGTDVLGGVHHGEIDGGSAAAASAARAAAVQLD